MNFHLNYTVPKLPLQIDHSQKLLMIGSCFAESIGACFRDLKFDCLVNPNGILFNPASIGYALESYCADAETGTTVIESKALFCDLDYHGEFSFATEKELREAMRSSRQAAREQLKNSQWLIITFGSAYGYRYLKSDRIVANCHKLPQSEFRKELLKMEEIVGQYRRLIKILRQTAPGLNILLTVSPVKYLRDGFVENNLSKSILIQAVHEIVNSNDNCFYFPAYELVSDDLRDYRFYKPDLAHPNEQAIAYVWEKFSGSAFTEETQQLNKRIQTIRDAAFHRPIHAGSLQHQQFKADYLKKCEELEKEFPVLDFTGEKKVFSS